MKGPNLPETIIPRQPGFSVRAECKVNAWASVAIALAIVADILISRHPQWPVLFRMVLLLSPVAAGLLWVRRLVKWVGGMDEMHRRISISAYLFASVATLLFLLACDQIDKLTAVNEGSNLLGITSFPWVVVFFGAFYYRGHVLFSRRYE